MAQLTKALANEWASKGINVNAIAPGYMATDNTTALRKIRSAVARFWSGFQQDDGESQAMLPALPFFSAPRPATTSTDTSWQLTVAGWVVEEPPNTWGQPPSAVGRSEGPLI